MENQDCVEQSAKSSQMFVRVENQMVYTQEGRDKESLT